MLWCGYSRKIRLKLGSILGEVALLVTNSSWNLGLASDHLVACLSGNQLASLTTWLPVTSWLPELQDI
jgi:hypothetical protein